MRVGVPTEIKNKEKRVAMTPSGVMAFVEAGHDVLLQKGCGEASGISDEEYIEVGGQIVENPDQVWACDMVMKVKEPLAEEYKYFREGLIIFAYLHLANEYELTHELINKKVTAIAYETIAENGNHPLLMPMSQVAGRMASIIGAEFLQHHNGGEGILLGSVPGVHRGVVTIIGGGNVGVNAAKLAVGLGANVNILDRNPIRLKELDDLFGKDVQTLMSNPKNVRDAVLESDLVIGAVLLPGGAKAPNLVSEETVKQMRQGSVIVDVAIDQGGIFETTDEATTLEDPIYVKHGVVHYAVPNIPGAVPKTSTYALTNATLPYALAIANGDLGETIKKNIPLSLGINTFGGHLTLESIAEHMDLPYVNINDLMAKKSNIKPTASRN